jgi:hypothetical protein
MVRIIRPADPRARWVVHSSWHPVATLLARARRVITRDRTRFFRTIAITEAVALFGFVLTFDFGPAWTYYAGGAFALIRFWTITAPTRSALRRDQDALNARGCGLSLTSALRGTLPPTNKWGFRPK